MGQELVSSALLHSAATRPLGSEKAKHIGEEGKGKGTMHDAGSRHTGPAGWLAGRDRVDDSTHHAIEMYYRTHIGQPGWQQQ